MDGAPRHRSIEISFYSLVNLASMKRYLRCSKDLNDRGLDRSRPQSRLPDSDRRISGFG